jgi:hypothetical protein
VENLAKRGSLEFCEALLGGVSIMSATVGTEEVRIPCRYPLRAHVCACCSIIAPVNTKTMEMMA